MKRIKWEEFQDVLENTKMIVFDETSMYISKCHRVRTIHRLVCEGIKPDDTIWVDDTFPAQETYETLTDILDGIEYRSGGFVV